MAYDAAEAVRAFERPTLTVERDRWYHYVFGIREMFGPTKTYTGRILSHPEWLPIHEKWIAFHKDGGTDDEARLLIAETCRAMKIPPKVVLRLPGSVMREAMEHFLACQYRASGLAQMVQAATKASLTSQPGTGSRTGSKRMSAPRAM